MKRYSVYHDGVEFEDENGRYYLVDDVHQFLGSIAVKNFVAQMEGFTVHENEFAQLQRTLRNSGKQRRKYLERAAKFKGVLMAIRDNENTPVAIRNTVIEAIKKVEEDGGKQ